MNTFFVNKRGFALVNNLVAFTLLSGMAYGWLHFFNNQFKAQRGLSNISEFEQLKTLIVYVLRNQTACTALFRDKIFDTGNVKFKLQNMQIFYPQAPQNIIAAVGMPVTPTSTLSELSLTKFTSVGNDQFTAILEARASSQNGAVASTKTIPLSFYTEVVGGNRRRITECLSTPDDEFRTFRPHHSTNASISVNPAPVLNTTDAYEWELGSRWYFYSLDSSFSAPIEMPATKMVNATFITNFNWNGFSVMSIYEPINVQHMIELSRDGGRTWETLARSYGVRVMEDGTSIPLAGTARVSAGEFILFRVKARYQHSKKFTQTAYHGPNTDLPDVSSSAPGSGLVHDFWGHGNLNVHFY